MTFIYVIDHLCLPRDVVLLKLRISDMKENDLGFKSRSTVFFSAVLFFFICGMVLFNHQYYLQNLVNY